MHSSLVYFPLLVFPRQRRACTNTVRLITRFSWIMKIDRVYWLWEYMQLLLLRFGIPFLNPQPQLRCSDDNQHWRAAGWLFFHKALAFTLSMDPLTFTLPLWDWAWWGPQRSWTWRTFGTSEEYCCLLNSMASWGNCIFKRLLKEPASIVVSFRNSYRIALSSWNSYSE